MSARKVYSASLPELHRLALRSIAREGRAGKVVRGPWKPANVGTPGYASAL